MAYFTVEQARSIIRDTYAEAAADAPAVAADLYAPAELAGLPAGAVALALGVGHPVRHAGLRQGEVVLDVGCGAGIDTLVAARAVGSRGRVIGLDMTPAMVERTRQHAAEAGLDQVEAREGLTEAIPLADASVDVVITNGVLNLSTRKSRALAEMLRVVRPGGRLALADLVVTEALPEECSGRRRRWPADWPAHWRSQCWRRRWRTCRGGLPSHVSPAHPPEGARRAGTPSGPWRDAHVRSPRRR
jgi:SAM-dependent methyltransferase